MRQPRLKSTRLKLFLLLGFFGSLLLAATAPTPAQDVRTNYMPGTDFSKFKTYRWATIEGGSHPNQIIDAEIKSAVDKQLAEKGFTKTDGASADLTATYQVAVDKERQWNAFGSTHTPEGFVSSQLRHTHLQCSHVGHPGPGTQKSSHLQPQQVTSTLFSSHTSRQTFLHGQTAPQRAHLACGAPAPMKESATSATAIQIAADKRFIAM